MNKSIRLDITQEERIKLKAEFDQLKSIEQKYSFWAEKLKRNYFLWAFYEQDNIKDFLIIPKNESETETLNKIVYSDYSLMARTDKTLEVMRKSFSEQVETSPDKETFIEYELKNIDDLIFKRKQVSISDNISQYEKNNFFIGGYEGYLLKKKEIDWKERVYQAHLLLEKIQGIEWAKYREYVKTYLKPKKKQIDIQLNGEQKFLVLYYLQFGDDIKANTTKSVLYDLFIDELKSSSIRPMLSDPKRYETIENLNVIIDLFRLLKLDSKAREIENKLPKNNKPKQGN